MLEVVRRRRLTTTNKSLAAAGDNLVMALKPSTVSGAVTAPGLPRSSRPASSANSNPNLRRLTFQPTRPSRMRRRRSSSKINDFVRYRFSRQHFVRSSFADWLHYETTYEISPWSAISCNLSTGGGKTRQWAEKRMEAGPAAIVKTKWEKSRVLRRVQ